MEVVNLRGLLSRTNVEGTKVLCVCVCACACSCVCVRFHVSLCHWEVAPACAVIAADRGREAANFSSGGRQKGAEEGFDEQDRCCGAEIPPTKRTNGHKARKDDQLTGPRQTSPIDQNRSGGLTLLINQRWGPGSQ